MTPLYCVVCSTRDDDDDDADGDEDGDDENDRNDDNECAKVTGNGQKC